MKLSIFFISLLFLCLSCSEETNHLASGKNENPHQNNSDDQTSWNRVNYNQNVSVNYYNPDNPLVYISKRNVHRVIQPICRGMNGCLQVCEYLQKPDCKKSSVGQVVDLWLANIHQHTNWEQARDDLDLIAKSSDVAFFLKNVDENNQILKTLFRMQSSANCPLVNKQNIFFSYTPQASLYLGSQTTDTTTNNDEEEVSQPSSVNIKKIIDGNLVPFDIQMFTSFVKQCFGYNSKTFIEMAATIENISALELGHNLISEACNKSDDCIRLAYCEIDSDFVWQKVGPEMQDLGCDFNDFSEFTNPELN